MNSTPFRPAWIAPVWKSMSAKPGLHRLEHVDQGGLDALDGLLDLIQVIGQRLEDRLDHLLGLLSERQGLVGRVPGQRVDEAEQGLDRVAPVLRDGVDEQARRRWRAP